MAKVDKRIPGGVVQSLSDVKEVRISILYCLQFNCGRAISAAESGAITSRLPDSASLDRCRDIGRCEGVGPPLDSRFLPP